MAGPWEKYQTKKSSDSEGPWSKFKSSKQEPKSEKKSTQAAAALEGFGEGATLGYLNNLQALADKPITAIGNFLTGNKVEADDYVKARDFYNKRQERLKEENPGSFGAGQVAGTIVSSMPVAKAAQGATVAARALQGAGAGALYAGLQNTSENEGEIGGLDIGERTKNALYGAATGAGASLGADAIGKGIEKGVQAVSSIKDRAGQYLKKGAEDLIENATGATRKQAENYREGTGRFLLDNKIAGFGDSAEEISKKSAAAIQKAEGKIDTSLRSLDDQGVKVSQDKVIEKIQERIASLREDSSQAQLVKNLEGIVDDIINTGKSEVKLSAAENTKRGYNTSSRMWDNPKGSAGKQADKIAYRAFKDAVEESAGAANPQMAAVFKEGKSDFGLLNPVVDAAEKRAKQLNQMPWGGLLDTASVLTGASQSDDPLSGGAMGLAAAIARRKIAPRMSSSVAVAMDGISKRLLSNPQMAQMAKVNPEAFRATVFSLAEEMSAGTKPTLKAAENDRPTKGPEKWVLDGIDKLNQAGIPAEELEALRGTKQGRNLLIEASDATPGSKRMESVLKRIRIASAGGQ